MDGDGCRRQIKLTEERHYWHCKKLRNCHCLPVDYNNASKKVRQQENINGEKWEVDKAVNQELASATQTRGEDEIKKNFDATTQEIMSKI